MSNFSTLGQVTQALEGSAVGEFTASTPDSYATITAPGYLNDLFRIIKANDIFNINYADLSTFPLNTGMNATFGEFQVTYNALTANWSLVPASGVISHTRVAATAVQWDAMSVTPILLVPAFGVNTIVMVEQIDIGLTYGSAPFAGGGVVGAEYGAVAALAGPAASSTEAAADFFVTASTMFRLGSGVGTGAPFATAGNHGVYLSNTVGPFTGGTGSTLLIDTYFRVVSLVA